MNNTEEKTVSFDDVKKEIRKKKVKDFLYSAKDKVVAVFEWGMKHPVESASILTGAGMTVRSLAKHSNERSERHRRETQFFEHRSGKWATAKRKLTSREQLEAETRHRNGETWTEILASMGLLK